MKKFVGFTPQQQFTLLSKQGYNGPADEASMAKFLAASPSAASKMGEYAQIAQQRLAGKPMPGQTMAEGGMVRPTVQTADKVPADTPPVQTDPVAIRDQSVTDPASLVKTPTVQKIAVTPDTLIDSAAGQVSDTAPVVAKSATVTGATATPKTPAATIEATTVAGDMPTAETVTGKVSDESLVEAQTMTKDELSQLAVVPPQISDPTKVIAPPARQVQPDELVSGSTVDMSKVNEAIDIQAAQADPSKQATVQGQLEGLMAQFEAGGTPAWAAGAMRQANAMMAARGLGASSMAGQAVIQAAMESALPIAMADAQTTAAFEAQNLSNRQQTALFGAEQRAKFLGMEFDQKFQTRVINAARISDIANLNFTSDVQISLENARLAQTANLANLDVSKAKMLSDMAAMSQMDMTNLNNRQQAAVQNAQAFLQTDLTNLNNEQQTTIFNTQTRANALLSDQAAQNAAKQFNAASENQTNQFFSELETTVSRFNAEQKNAIAQFNAGEANAAEKFNTQTQNLRDQFNASNALVIAQANAQWRQNTTTLDTAAQNEANAQAAATINKMTQNTVDQVWQRERDIMGFAIGVSEGEQDRLARLLVADKEFDTVKFQEAAKDTRAKYSSIVNFANTLLED